MYIVYDTHQYEIWSADGHIWSEYTKPQEYCEEPDFKPTLLVRTSDMQVVPGHSTTGAYWALSYSWNQSGELVKKKANPEETERIDKGKHKIISYQGSKVVIQYVNFQGFIQKICKDFGIRYIWFDQMCILQGDSTHKASEIQQMYRIYGNACCTLALIPELGYSITDGLANVGLITTSQWSKRAWTLEEAYMSKKLLFIGSNVHMYSSTIEKELSRGLTVGNFKCKSFLQSLCKKAEGWSASTALWHGHSRTSTKAHDRIFAFANIFPDLMQGINFSYKQPLFDLELQFYRCLASNDLTILCFGVPDHPFATYNHISSTSRTTNLLPSWTGVGGVHVPQTIQGFRDERNRHVRFKDYTVIDEMLHLQCEYRTIPILRAVSFSKSKALSAFPPIFGIPQVDDDIFLLGPGDDDLSDFKKYGVRPTHVLRSSSWYGDNHFFAGYLSLTEENCSECLILTEVSFMFSTKDSVPYLYGEVPYYASFIADRRIGFMSSSTSYAPVYIFPVVRKDGNYFKSIGICFTQNHRIIFSDPEHKQPIVIK